MTNLKSHYTPEQKSILLTTAKDSIKHGLETGSPLPVIVSEYPSELQQKRATFVTLKIDEELRGCIGVLEAYRPLIEDVAQNAYSAAFRDSRFPPLTKEEFESVDLSISILTPSEPIEFASEQDLLEKIRPGVDGLILEDGLHRGTFLPAVWESVSSPFEFLMHLKMKAGLPPNYWSDTIKFKRYTSESIS